MALIHVELTVYPHTACIHLMASYVDGRAYTLWACWRYFLFLFVGLLGCHCPWAWVNDMRYRPCSSLLTMRIGSIWHEINASFSFYIVTPSFVKMGTLPSSDVLPTLIRYVGNYSNVSASAALMERCGNGTLVNYLPLHSRPLAKPTLLTDTCNIGRPNFFCPLRWGSVRLRLNRTLTFLLRRHDGTWRL